MGEHDERLERIEKCVHEIKSMIAHLIKQGAKDMSDLDNAITDLQTKVAAETSVEQSAITLLNGIPKMIADAVAAAQAAGASQAQLAAIAAVGASIQSSSASLAAAVTANTPAAPPAPPAGP